MDSVSFLCAKAMTLTHAKLEALDFILLVAKSLNAYGAAAHHIEAALRGLASRYCEDGEFLVAPTAIIVSVKIKGQWHSRLQRVSPGGIDLGRLSLLDRIGEDVINGKMEIRDGIQRIQEAAQTRSGTYSTVLKLIFFVIASSAFGCFFVFRWQDILAVAILSLIASLILEICYRSSKLSQVAEFLVSLIISFLTTFSSYYLLPMPEERIILSSLIVLIPGLSLTIALSEIGTKNWLAGTARLMGAAVELLKITFGVVLGSSATQFFTGTGSPEFQLQSTSLFFPEQLILLCSALSLAYLFNCETKDYPWVLAGACIGYYGAKIGASLFDQQLGVFLGGTCLAAFSNAFARFQQRPALIILLPGLIPMVPGSVGYRSLNFLFHQDVMAAMTSTFAMVIVAVSLVAGLTLGNILVHPRRSI